MTSTRDPMATFDEDTLRSVASETGLSENRLRDLARRHQERVRDLPGVDDIVYEWRNQFHQDPLVHRSEAAYVLALRDHVWIEFGDNLGVSEEELRALQSLHDAQARALVSGNDRLDADDALVLTRP